MGAIRILPDRVANQIAAGEVIERPVAVVKELVENSLDAGSTRIEIEFQNGGKSLIRVQDNGSGMSPDDCLLSLERHATSKVRKADDLLRIISYGFRGEALPSIASVSRFTMRTRSKGWEHGTEVLVNGGKYIHRKDCGMPVGTGIEVAHLFNSVPVRRKFLKTENTEAAHIIHLARLYALSNPSVSFTLLEKGRRVFQSPVCPNLRERVIEIFGKQTARDLIEIESARDGLSLRGLMGKPGVGRSTRQEMVTFVNRRPVDSRMLNFALIEAYHTYIPKGRYPLIFLFLDLDPAGVDINVHPAKREVRFREEGRMRHFIITAILERLREFSGIPPAALAPFSATPAPVPAPSAQSPAAKAVPAGREEPASTRSAGINREREAKPVPSFGAGREGPVPPARPRLDWRFLGLAHEAYALFESEAGLILLNRRGAEERILFETISQRLKETPSSSQPLLFPLVLELDPILASTLSEHLAFFEAKGFQIEPFGRNCFRAEALPDWLDPTQGEDFLRDLIGLIKERGIHPENPDLAREKIALRAAMRAAKATTPVSPEEMEALARGLMACRDPLTDPRGKATFFEIPRSDLEKKFGK